jgi:hypothetical protein
MPDRIFYSWQSDLPNNTNRGFILDALAGAVADIRGSADLKVDPVVDRDTAGVAGAPDIGQTIFSKIEGAAAFVCDVSIIHPDGTHGRRTPNPNVLVEMGYALKSLGTGKIVLVMNTAFGEPELLPFDLKQKRVIAYRRAPEETGAPSKKELRGRLAQALKLILAEHVESQAAQKQATLLQVAVEAVIEGRSDLKRRVRDYMQSVVEDLKRLDPPNTGTIDDEALVGALGQSVPIVRDFARLAEAVASANSEEAAKELLKGFERILELYDLPKGSSGPFRSIDFDFYKFLGHELFVVFCGHLIREERWTILEEVVDATLYVETGRGESNKPVGALSAYVGLLDEVRTKRLATNSTRRISFHADLLKERHEDGGPLAGTLSWREFIDTELILYLRSFSRGHDWLPRVWVYLDSHDARFLNVAKSPPGAQQLAQILGIADGSQLRDTVKTALQKLNDRASRSSMFADGLSFNADTIADI